MQSTRQFQFSKMAVLAAVSAAALATGGCTSIRDHRGYLFDPALTGAIQPGIDNKQSVEGTLGHPSFASQYGDPVYYYVSSTTEQRVFGVPQPEEHKVLKVAFDASGTVTSVSQTGMEDVRKISPDGDETETMGRDRSFLQDLFGNIGTVGGAGASGPSGPGPNGS
jgi:outer membrane protein assembly factor BamE (lipoprotein component of BamABCDE complex)